MYIEHCVYQSSLWLLYEIKPLFIARSLNTSPQWHQRASSTFVGFAAHSTSMLERDLSLVSALILTRIDYCNSVLAGIPDSTLATLQRVLHAAARFVRDLRPRDRVHCVECTSTSPWASGPPILHSVPWPRSLQPKQNLDPFSRFRTANSSEAAWQT